MKALKDRSKGDEMTQQERWETEHVDIQGHLRVPVRKAWNDPTPVREGWEPFFVSINLDRIPQKNVIYKRKES